MARQVGTAPKISAKSPTPTKSPKPKTDQPGRPVMNDPTMRAMSKQLRGRWVTKGVQIHEARQDRR
jgi:hypothetical protein